MSVIWDVRDGELVTVQSPYKEAREQASWWENIFSLIKSGTETWDTLVQSGLIKPTSETALPIVSEMKEVELSETPTPKPWKLPWWLIPSVLAIGAGAVIWRLMGRKGRK